MTKLYVSIRASDYELFEYDAMEPVGDLSKGDSGWELSSPGLPTVRISESLAFQVTIMLRLLNQGKSLKPGPFVPSDYSAD